MPGFTSEEVRAATDRFLLKQLTVPRLSSGNRDVLSPRNTIYDLVSTTLLLRPDAYFYVIWLASNVLRGLVAQQIATITAVETAAAGVDRPFKLVESTAELTNAQAALLELNAGLNARTAGIQGAIGPAVDRFRLSVARFIGGELTKNVVSGGQVIETATEMRATVASEWASALPQHEVITARLELLDTAITALSAASLPETSVRSIVQKIRTRLDELKELMEGNDAVGQSREAFLDLLTMRTLLAKASSFRDPLLTLMPLKGDPTTGTLIDSSGVAPTLSGTVSGPFNYGTGETLQFTIDGASSTPTINLPSSSNAELRSQPLLSFPYPPVPSGAYDLNITYSAGTKAALSLGDSYATGTALAAAITSAATLAPEVTCAWDAATSQLVFRDVAPADESHLRFNETTTNLQEYTDVILGGYPRENYASPVAVEEVARAIETTTPLVDVSVEEVVYATFVGERRAGLASDVWDIRDENTDLSTDNAAATVSSPSTNFESLGIEVGWGMVITAPFSQTVAITAVNGGMLTVSPAPTSTVSGATYYIGPDYTSIPAGARVQLTGGDALSNTGFRRMSGAGLVAQLPITPTLTAEDSSLTVVVYTRFLELAARTTATTTGLGVLAGNAAVGLATVVESAAGLTALQITAGDFLSRGVRVGDSVTLVSPGSITYARDVAAVATRTLTLTESLPYEAGPWDYTIVSFRHQRYSLLLIDAAAYNATDYAGDDFSRLDPLVGRSIRGARFTTTISVPLASYKEALTKLQIALDQFEIPREVAVDSMVRAMKEQGFDRATDLLLSLDILEFFSMEVDEVSYATNLVRKAATAGREVTPVTKYARGHLIGQEFRHVSFQPNPFDPQDPTYDQ